MTEIPKDECWAICELMGHVKLAGRLTEVEMFGSKMGRLDIPALVPCPTLESESHKLAPECCPDCHGAGTVDSFVTQLFGGASVYRITIVTEAVARHVCKQNSPAPVSPWDFPKLPAPETANRVYEKCGHTVEDCDCDPEDEDYICPDCNNDPCECPQF